MTVVVFAIELVVAIAQTSNSVMSMTMLEIHLDICNTADIQT